MVLAASALALVLLSCGGADLTAPHPPSGEEADAVAWLQASQAAGLLRHDLTTYLAVWAPEATLTVARGPEPGPHDRTLDYAAIAATRAERFFAAPTGTRRLHWTEVHAAQAGERLTLRWVAHSAGDDDSDRVAERFELRRSRAGEPAGWRVVYNRLWPTWQSEGKAPPVVFDHATWKALDDRATEPACSGLPCPRALLAAWRFGEAHDAARAWTEQPGLPQKGPEATERWLWRGLSAVFSGRVADAEPSFAQALALDPAVQLPPWRSADAARRKAPGP